MTMLVVWFVLTFGLVTQPRTIIADKTHAAIIANSPTTKTDSTVINEDPGNSKTKDGKKLEIIKQIRRVNRDGSFVVGYEAVDGTFKIESRDVLGNIMGTYGYIDENGEIKRVSYTANNTTNGLKSVQHQIVDSPRENKTTASTQKSSSVGSSAVPSLSNIITIPKMRTYYASTQVSKNYQQLYTTPKIWNMNHDQKSEPTTTIVYATSIEPTAKPNTMSTTRSVPKTDKIEINERLSKVINVNKIHKILNNTDVKSERRQVRGNLLRRQLSKDQSENFETSPQVVYSQSSDEDSVHGTQRTIFTTTSNPRIPALVLAARNRAAVLKNAALQNKNHAEKMFSKSSRWKSDPSEDSSSEPLSENEYPTQSPMASQIPTDKETSHDDIGPPFRQLNTYLPKSKELLRGSIPRQYKFPIKPKFLQREMETGQYLRETSEPNIKDPNKSNVEQYVSNDENAETHSILQSNPNYQEMYGPQQNLRTDSDQRFQQFPLPMQIHQPQLHGTNSPYQSYLDRPLTARDFERLLNILVLRHQQYQRLGFSSGQNLLASGFNYRGNYNPYYHQIPQPPVYSQFDPRYTVFSRSLPPIPPPDSFYAPYSEQENMYQAQNQIEQQLPYSIQSRRNYDNKQFVNSYYRTNSNHFPHAKASTHENIEYLPQDIREDILWRMLMLSIHSDINANMANIPVPVASTIQTTTSLPESKKPVRSVQILGEE